MTMAASAPLACSAIFQQLLPRPRAPVAAPHEMMRLAAAAPAPKPKPAAEELHLSDFDKIAPLGDGACGVVTKVRLRGTRAEFALKTAYYPEANGSEEEADVLRRVAGSPHLVRCDAVLRTSAGAPALLLELMDAGSLGRVIQRRGRGRGLPEPALAEVTARCLAGLAHLHSRGVAHLDLKPDNLLANSSGDVKIADFSVSRIFCDPAGQGIEVSVSVGTTAYKSPERFAPNATAGPRVACAADVWSLGLTVLELFLGQSAILPSCARPSWEQLMETICYGEAPSVPDSVTASTELRGFVSSCLHKDPRRRATVAQLLAHPFVAGRDVEASRRALREFILETM